MDLISPFMDPAIMLCRATVTKGNPCCVVTLLFYTDVETAGLLLETLGYFGVVVIYRRIIGVYLVILVPNKL